MNNESPGLPEIDIRARVRNTTDSWKSESVDDILAEYLRNRGGKANREIVRLRKNMFEEGEWPADMFEKGT